MSYKRTVIAAAAFLAVMYLKLALPVFASEVIPALQTTLEEAQAIVVLSEETATWLGWD